MYLYTHTLGIVCVGFVAPEYVPTSFFKLFCATHLKGKKLQDFSLLPPWLSAEGLSGKEINVAGFAGSSCSLWLLRAVRLGGPLLGDGATADGVWVQQEPGTGLPRLGRARFNPLCPEETGPTGSCHPPPTRWDPPGLSATRFRADVRGSPFLGGAVRFKVGLGALFCGSRAQG